MFLGICNWLHRQLGMWSPVRVIVGGPDGKNHSAYMVRLMFTPSTPWGQLYVHVFYREDLDRDPHDHPFGFWTWPVNQGYVEEVFEHDERPWMRVHHRWLDEHGQERREHFPGTHCFREQHVAQGRWHYRPATHTHRILRTDSGRWPLVTIVWRGPTTRKWGFWTYARTRSERTWTHWKEYVYGRGLDNLPGDADRNCPGHVQ